MTCLRHWVIPEKIHTSPTDGTLEILAGGGVEGSGNHSPVKLPLLSLTLILTFKFYLTFISIMARIRPGKVLI